MEGKEEEQDRKKLNMEVHIDIRSNRSTENAKDFQITSTCKRARIESYAFSE